MKMLNILLLISMLSFGAATFADEFSEIEAEKLLETMGMDQAMTQSINQMLDLQLQKNPQLQPFKEVMLTFFHKHLSYEVLKPQLTKIYAEEFTTEELKAINAFYVTSAGKKTIEKMPSLMQKGMQIGEAQFYAHIDELEAMIKAEVERISNKHSLKKQRENSI